MLTRRCVEISRAKVGSSRLWLYREIGTNRAIFRYTWSPDIELKYDLLSEVSALLSKSFAHMIDSLGYRLALHEDDESFYNILLPKR